MLSLELIGMTDVTVQLPSGRSRAKDAVEDIFMLPLPRIPSIVADLMKEMKRDDKNEIRKEIGISHVSISEEESEALESYRVPTLPI